MDEERVIILLLTSEALKKSSHSNTYARVCKLFLEGIQINFNFEKRPFKSSTFLNNLPAFFQNYYKNIRDYDYVIDNIERYNSNDWHILTQVERGNLIHPFVPFVVTDIDKKVLSGYVKIKKGYLVILPSTQYNSQMDLVYKLGKSFIEPHGEIRTLSPVLEKEIKILSEEERLKKQNERKEELEATTNELSRYRRLKNVLAFDGDELRDLIMELFEKIGIKTYKHDTGEEDFWLLDESNIKFVICEVKGKKKNMERSDINKLDDHRTNNVLASDFPALLIVNTFKEALNLSEKNVEVPPDIRKHAENNNVLVTRTLDLIQILNIVHSNKSNFQDLIEFLKKERGWLTCKEEKIIVKREKDI